MTLPATFGRAILGSVFVMLSLAGCSDEGEARAASEALTSTVEQRLVPEMPTSNTSFGWRVTVSSDGARAFVSNQPGVGGGSYFGYVDVMRRTGTAWTLEQHLPAPPDAERHAQAFDADGAGERLLIGAPGEDVGSAFDAGRVRVYARAGTTWTVEATLDRPRGTGPVVVGYGRVIAVSASGDRAAVASDTAIDVIARTGTTWAREATWSVSSPAASLDLDDDGSRLAIGMGDEAALVYARVGTAWAEEAALMPADIVAGDRYGESVAISADGRRVVVGARAADLDASRPDVGAAYVYARVGTTWALETRLLASDPALNDVFGCSVAITRSGAQIAVGTYGDDGPVGTNPGSVRMFSRSGASWTEVARITDPLGAVQDWLGFSVAMPPDGTRLFAGIPFSDGMPDDSRGSVLVAVLSGELGEGCETDAGCDSGFCTDGVCCESRCGGAATDCQACAAALTGGIDGECAVAAAGAVCREGASACDGAEVCDGASMVCPADIVAPTGTVCREAVSRCDVAETCDGVGALCPSDAIATAGVVCREVDPDLRCDAVEVCTGETSVCPADGAAPPSTVCRPSAGPCDVAERCDGTSPSCPAADLVSPDGTECGGAAERSCTTEGTCNGVSVACIGGTPLPEGTPCAPRDEANPCDAADFCDDAGLCVDGFASATTECDAAGPGGPCDAPDHCDGETGACVDGFLDGVECRPAAGGCDATELCSGASPLCPPDLLEPAGQVCRAPTDTTCDQPEACDGASAVCPADVTMCVMRDGGGGADGGTPSDTGAATPAAGCSCGVGHRGGGWALLVIGLALLLRRR